jgi:hypothetical protein
MQRIASGQLICCFKCGKMEFEKPLEKLDCHHYSCTLCIIETIAIINSKKLIICTCGHSTSVNK